MTPLVKLTPVTQRAARAWVNKTHRHLSAPQGDLFRVGLMVNGELSAVGIAGRPCRMLQDGRTAELLRIASAAESSINANSRLYSALTRAGMALGYERFVTYTLATESGRSLLASNFEDDGLTDGGEWSRPSRKRRETEQPGRKRRWLWPRRSSGLWDDVNPGARE